MKLHSLLASVVLGSSALVASQIQSHAQAASNLDFGDFSSATLTGKAWAANAKGDKDSALGYTAKCIEMYDKEARAQQAKLQAPAPKDQAFEYWALNDVGTCYFLTGQIKEAKGDKEGATAAYKVLVNDLKFAQCWDPKGWFWQPAGAAEGRLKTLEFEAMSSN